MFLQEGQLLLCLHTFGNGLQIQAVRHSDRSPDDCLIAGVGRQVLDNGISSLYQGPLAVIDYRYHETV